MTRRDLFLRHLAKACLAIALGLAGTLSAAVAAQARSYHHYVEGNPAGTAPDKVSGGLLLMGGGDRNLDAMRWFFAKAGHGHIVILRATQQGQIGKEFYREVGGILSAETFVTRDRSAADDARLQDALRHADGIFLSGGDQGNYVRRWKGTPIAAIIDAHVAAGKPLGGTSAGLAMLGEKLYGCMDGISQTSGPALAAPFGPSNTIEDDFLHLALLKGVITDTHFKERDRLGRLFAFVAKAQVGWPGDRMPLIGLGVDESASLAVEPDGSARIFATAPDGGAWLVQGDALRLPVTSGPLDVAGIRVIGIGHASRLFLPEGRVENPAFVRDYAVSKGVMQRPVDVVG
ncbi:cyanophycinase [Novosphingobium sp.]|uniref:cyanophycinase n=1 Tax=Novosphingobium sp. TaxID=1874826 RepID=UPI0038BBB259